MLGRLIKYDLKSLNRFLIIIHAFLLLLALLIRIFFTEHIPAESLINPETDTLPMTLVTLTIIFSLVITCVSFATGLIITVRFYRNLFSDEGYLTQTLPVTRGQHLLAKTISGSIWSCIDVFFIFASMYIIAATPEVIRLFHEYEPEIRAELGLTGSYSNVTFAAIAVFFLVFSFIGAISNVISYYASVVFGQLFSGHRVFGAIAAYFAISTAAGILVFLFALLSGLYSTHSYSAIIELSPAEYLKNTIVLSTVFAVVTGAVLYGAAYWVMNKKLNLA